MNAEPVSDAEVDKALADLRAEFEAVRERLERRLADLEAGHLARAVETARNAKTN